MPREKYYYESFKKRMRIVKSLVNDAQVLIPESDFQGAKRLITAAKLLLPSEYYITMAKREAPLMMALRGERPKSSKAALYSNVIRELSVEVDEMLRKRYFSSRRSVRDNVA